MEFDAYQSSSAGYLANHMARLFAHALAEAIRPLGLAPAQFMTLLELWRQEGVTQRDLAERLDVEQATMASTLGRMARDGLIERRLNPNDARSQCIFLTPRARALREPALAAAKGVNAKAIGGLKLAEQAALLAMMTRVIAALRA